MDVHLGIICRVGCTNMSNRKEHEKFGSFVAIEVYKEEVARLGIQPTVAGRLIATATSIWTGNNIATLPDKIEPALSPHHRGIWHSVDAFKLIETAKQNIRDNPGDDWRIDVFLIMCLSAYQSHILLDSQTPMGVQDHQWVWDLLEIYKNN
jgi:membrane-bound metal-dependent hydrolase YbcI (DUF457 family)